MRVSVARVLTRPGVEGRKERSKPHICLGRCREMGANGAPKKLRLERWWD